jgi:hypothetical protein
MQEVDKSGMARSLLESGDLRNPQTADRIESLAFEMEEIEERDWTLGELAAALAENGKEEKAIELAGSMETPLEKANALRRIAAQCLKQGRSEQAMKILIEAEAAACEIDAAWQKAESLNGIANVMIAAKDEEGARRVRADAVLAAQAGQASSDLQDSLDCSSVLAEIARDMASAGETESALEVARTIKSLGKQQRAWDAIAKLATDAGDQNRPARA